MQRQPGFTLLEILIALIVASILAAVAIPSYRNHVVKSNRQVAVRTLLDVSAQFEAFRLKNRSYPEVLGSGYGNTVYVDRLGKYSASSTTGSVFEITLEEAEDKVFSLQAAAVGTQADDVVCQTWTLTSTGSRSATGAAHDTINECWKN
jgi:type IV pilus assembly protein PilE